MSCSKVYLIYTNGQGFQDLQVLNLLNVTGSAGYPADIATGTAAATCATTRKLNASYARTYAHTRARYTRLL